MDIAEASRFIAENHRGVLATIRGDGKPQLSPVSVGIDGSGRVVISSREAAMKTHNLRRNPFASLCVFSDRFFGEWVQVEGSGEVISLPEAMDGLVDYYRRISGEHPDWDEYRAAMAEQKRVLIKLAIERAGPNRSG
ncbi:MAG: PPOX class F420-dependent oxidoreductase [Acidimicrobiales bacterium]